MENKTISTSASFNFGWLKFKQKASLFIGIAIFITVLSSIQQSYQLAEKDVLDGTPGLYLYILTLLGFLISSYLSLGVWRIMIKHSRNEEIEFSDLFRVSFKNLINYLIANLVAGIVTLIGFIFFIVPGIHIALRLMFISAYIVDENQNFEQALKSSWAITKGHTVKLFIWGLLATAIVILGFLSLIFGLFIAMPIVSLAYAFLYLKLREEDIVNYH